MENENKDVRTLEQEINDKLPANASWDSKEGFRGYRILTPKEITTLYYNRETNRWEKLNDDTSTKSR